MYSKQRRPNAFASRRVSGGIGMTVTREEIYMGQSESLLSNGMIRHSTETMVLPKDLAWSSTGPLYMGIHTAAEEPGRLAGEQNRTTDRIFVSKTQVDG